MSEERRKVRLKMLANKVIRVAEMADDVQFQISESGPKIISELIRRGRTYKEVAWHAGCSIAYIWQCASAKKVLSNEMFLKVAELALINEIKTA